MNDRKEPEVLFNPQFLLPLPWGLKEVQVRAEDGTLRTEKRPLIPPQEICCKCGIPRAGFRYKESKRGSTWEVICSLCFLYESDWSWRRRNGIPTYIDAAERDSGERWLRDSRGRIFSRTDADHVLTTIFFRSKLMFDLSRGLVSKGAVIEMLRQGNKGAEVALTREQLEISLKAYKDEEKRRNEETP